jgi:6-phosphogluconolactonase
VRTRPRARPWCVVRDGERQRRSNDAKNNQLLVFDRYSDGSLKQVKAMPTGGKGGLEAQPGCTPICPMLDSQGSVASTSDGHLVFAVNAGSNTITSFWQSPWGMFKIDSVSSGGAFPNSLTVHGDTLYVVNSNSGNIKGFKFSYFGHFAPISGSTQKLSANPPVGVNARQIGFDNTGHVLTVAIVGASLIDTFKVDGSGRATPATAPPTKSAAPLPFGFAFDPKNRLVMSEVTDLKAFGTTSTYNLNAGTAKLAAIDSKPSNGAAPCWVVVTKDGKYVFVVNAGGGPPAEVARYGLGADGKLTSLGPNTGENGDEFARTDEDLSPDSQYLYVLNPALMAPKSKIDEYKVGADGSLTQVGATDANLPPGISGLIVR